VAFAVLLATTTAAPASASSADAYPGAAIDVSGTRCTGAFLLVARDGRRFYATAGHCVPVAARPDRTTPAGDRIWRPGRGPLVRDAAGRALGRVAFAALGPGVDIALVELGRGVRAGNTIPGAGRVTHVVTAPQPGDETRLYGQGVVVDSTSPARRGVVSGVEASIVRLVIPSTPGDSGGPVYDPDLGAVGILMGSDVSVTPTAGVIRASRFSVMVRRAAAVLGPLTLLAR
jgi:hypothetical protein